MDDFLLENDLAPYVRPTAYARLNVVERALLGQRLKAEGANVARSLRELWEMIPPNPERQDRLFETALRGRALEAGGDKSGWGAGLDRAKDKANAARQAGNFKVRREREAWILLRKCRRMKQVRRPRRRQPFAPNWRRRWRGNWRWMRRSLRNSPFYRMR